MGARRVREGNWEEGLWTMRITLGKTNNGKRGSTMSEASRHQAWTANRDRRC